MAEPPPGPPLDLGPLADQLNFALRRAQHHVLADLHRRFAAFAVRPAQYAVLTLLARNPGRKQTEIAAALGLKRTNFVPLLDELAARGLAERRAVAGDRRASAVYLTEAGAAVLAQLDTEAAAHEAALAARLGSDGKARLLALLRALA